MNKFQGEYLRTISYYYAKITNSMLRMRGHVSAGFSRCDVLFLQGN